MGYSLAQAIVQVGLATRPPGDARAAFKARDLDGSPHGRQARLNAHGYERWRAYKNALEFREGLT